MFQNNPYMLGNNPWAKNNGWYNPQVTGGAGNAQIMPQIFGNAQITPQLFGDPALTGNTPLELQTLLQGQGQGQGQGQVHGQWPAPANNWMPPGLAKKGPDWMPPGLARKGEDWMPPGLANKGPDWSNPGAWVGGGFNPDGMNRFMPTMPQQPQQNGMSGQAPIGAGQPSSLPYGATNAPGLEQYQSRFSQMPWARNKSLFGF